MKKDVIARCIIGGLSLLVLLLTWFSKWPAALHVEKTIMSGTVYGLLGLLTVYIMWSAAASLRDYTARIIGPSGWFHYNPSQIPEPIGKLQAWRLDGVLARKFRITMDGNGGTLLVPPDAAVFIGEFLQVDAVWERIDANELPPPYRRALQRKGFTEPYYLALYPTVVHERARGKVEKIHEMILKSVKDNATEAALRDIVKTSHATSTAQRRLNERLTRPPMTSRVRQFLSREEDDHDNRYEEQGP